MKSILILGLMMASQGVEAKTIEVKMVNNSKLGIMAFEPAFVKADPGDTIKFIPTDLSHNSTAIVVPKGEKPWIGKMSKEVSVTLKKEGVYIYKCDPHISMAMVGVVQVGAKTPNLSEAKAEASKLASSFMMNKDRLEKLMAQVK